jgi:hypothetical protein
MWKRMATDSYQFQEAILRITFSTNGKEYRQTVEKSLPKWVDLLSSQVVSSKRVIFWEE